MKRVSPINRYQAIQQMQFTKVQILGINKEDRQFVKIENLIVATLLSIVAMWIIYAITVLIRSLL